MSGPGAGEASGDRSSEEAGASPATAEAAPGSGGDPGRARAAPGLVLASTALMLGTVLLVNPRSAGAAGLAAGLVLSAAGVGIPARVFRPDRPRGRAGAGPAPAGRDMDTRSETGEKTR